MSDNEVEVTVVPGELLGTMEEDTSAEQKSDTVTQGSGHIAGLSQSVSNSPSSSPTDLGGTLGAGNANQEFMMKVLQMMQQQVQQSNSQTLNVIQKMTEPNVAPVQTVTQNEQKYQSSQKVVQEMMSAKNKLANSQFPQDDELTDSSSRTGTASETYDSDGHHRTSAHKNSTNSTPKLNCFEHCCDILESKDEERGNDFEAADPALIMGAERTLFAALNNAWLLALAGISLMSVGNNDERATYGGITILLLGIVSTVVAYVVHFTRVAHMKNNEGFRFGHTLLWTTIIASLTIASLTMELYFGVLHPYLDREKAVTITNGNP